MKAVLQRVASASVSINGKIHGEIKNGLLVLLGVEKADNDEDTEWLCKKIIQLRIFGDDSGLMNRSVQDIDGDILLISQFTLHASTQKGNRPSFIKAARPEQAIPLYEKTIVQLETLSGKKIATGIFGAAMQVSLVNDGPVTIIIDSKNRE